MNALTKVLRTPLVSGRMSQRRMVRIRANGIMDRMGPETPQVYSQFGMHLLVLVTILVQASQAVSVFEVENPWEHFYAQVPRIPHGGTMMST